MQISLNSIDKVKDFVTEASEINASMDLMSGKYIVDAKSIMGIFSLDLTKPIELILCNTDEITEETMQKFNKLVEKYEV